MKLGHEDFQYYFQNGRLIRVRGGTHGAMSQANAADKYFVDHLVQFMEATKPGSVDLPKEIKLPPLKFMPLDGPSLFDLLVK